MDYADRILTLRKNNNLTQKQLAANTNLSEMSIRFYESRRRQPACDALVALANTFNVSLDYLVGRSDNPARV